MQNQGNINNNGSMTSDMGKYEIEASR